MISHSNEPRERGLDPIDEGGLHAPAELSFWGKAWWWFDFLILLKLARLRFILLLALIGLIIAKWGDLLELYDRWTRPAGQIAEVRSDVEFFCPMHPTVVRDSSKEKCPICFMPLSKRKKGEATDQALPPGTVSRVQLSPYRVVQAGIQTVAVDKVPLRKEIQTVGTIEFNERGLKHIAARVKGRIDALYVSETGQTVEADDALASLYSPDLVVTMQSLLEAQRSGNQAAARDAVERLRLWGIRDDQVQELLSAGKANTHLKIRSPIRGHVLKKYVKEGQYVDEGSPLYDIADLSSVWVQAQIYEEDVPFLGTQPHQHDRRAKEGPKVPIVATTRTAPGQVFHGQLSFVFPHVDQESRTLTIRFELDNPGHQLRPGTSCSVKLQPPLALVPFLRRHSADQGARAAAMAATLRALTGNAASSRPLDLAASLAYVQAEADLSASRLLAVPESAVIDTGSQQIVYREYASGEFEGMQVELGPRLAGADGSNWFPVLAGLTQGDRIVVSGSFLLDAETRLNPAAGSIYFGGSGGKAGGGTSGSSVRPSTPKESAPASEVEQRLAKLSPADRKLAEAQKLCPVTAAPVAWMDVPYKVMVRGEPVFLCCQGCEKRALRDPERTLKSVASSRKTPSAQP